MAPIMCALRVADKDGETAGEIHDDVLLALRQLEGLARTWGGELAAEAVGAAEVVAEVWYQPERHTSMHGGARIVHPSHHGENLLGDAFTKLGFQQSARKHCRGDRGRQQKIVDQYTDRFAKGRMYTGNPIHHPPTTDEKESMEDAERVRRGERKATWWWNLHGGATPELAAYALTMVGQPCSSSVTERVFSTHGNIQTVRRTALNKDKLEKQVFVYTHLRKYREQQVQKRRAAMQQSGEREEGDAPVGEPMTDEAGEREEPVDAHCNLTEELRAQMEDNGGWIYGHLDDEGLGEGLGGRV